MSTERSSEVVSGVTEMEPTMLSSPPPLSELRMDMISLVSFFITGAVTFDPCEMMVADMSEADMSLVMVAHGEVAGDAFLLPGLSPFSCVSIIGLKSVEDVTVLWTFNTEGSMTDESGWSRSLEGGGGLIVMLVLLSPLDSMI